MKVSRYHDELIIETDGVCRNCHKEVGDHIDEKCPFDSTQYVPMSHDEVHAFALKQPCAVYARNYGETKNAVVLKTAETITTYTYEISYNWD